jgi:DinB superfamily
MADPQKSLREHLRYLLKGEGAHASFEDAVKDFPAELRGKKLNGFPHTAWMLLEHLRLAQLDILEYSRDPKHVSPKWPEGYWPKQEAPPSAEAWNKSVATFKADLKAMQALVTNPKTDLFVLLPGTDGHTVLREALLLADHNAYHVGQLVMLRRMLGAWQE